MARDSFQHLNVRFANGKDRLAGIIVKPAIDTPCPALVLVHGSGPADRDSRGGFTALREHFARCGCAVLSYDKPGVGESRGDWRQQTFNDRAKEVLSAVHFLHTHPSLHTLQIGLCGASQAGWVMPIAAQPPTPIAFIISISGAAVTVEEQERYRIEHQLQADQFSHEQVSQALRVYDHRLTMIRQGVSLELIVTMQNRSRNEPWFPYLADITEDDLRYFQAIYQFDPAPFLHRVRCPFLGLWGALDTCVPVEKSMRLTRQALTEAGNPQFELKLLPHTNHGMRLAETGSPKESGTEFAPELWETLTEWLATTLATSP